MRIVRYQTASHSPTFGWMLEDKVGVLEGSPYSEFSRVEAVLSLDEVNLLPPCEPTKIICVGRNYLAHAKEHDADVPEVPLIFLKPPSTLIAHGGTIFLPPQSNQVEHEAELAVVIGKSGRWIPPEEAGDHILGYTVANDVTARDLQFKDGQWTRGKGFDTFCPIGPWIETEFDPADVLITCHVNEEMRQMASTRDMVFSVRKLIAFISSVMTLEPGDLILTGTPSGVGILMDGDQVQVEIEGLGTLRNQVKAEPSQ